MEIPAYYCGEMCYTVRERFESEEAFCGLSGVVSEKGSVYPVPEIHPGINNAAFEQVFEKEYTHNSTAIEGNTLSLIQTIGSQNKDCSSMCRPA